MGELHGQILGMLIVIAVFAAIVAPLTALFTKLIKNVDDEVELVVSNASDIDFDDTVKAYEVTGDLMSF